MHLTGDGPATPIMLVLLDTFQAEAADIKKDFLAQPPAHVGHPGFGTTLTIQHPDESGQEAEAKKSVAKLMILCLQGDVDVRLAKIANVSFAQPAAGMQVVMDNPCSGGRSPYPTY